MFLLPSIVTSVPQNLRVAVGHGESSPAGGAVGTGHDHSAASVGIPNEKSCSDPKIKHLHRHSVSLGPEQITRHLPLKKKKNEFSTFLLHFDRK